MLAKPATFSGKVKDREGKPVAGARVQFGTVQRYGNGASWGYAPNEVLGGTPLEPFFFTTSDAQGKFVFTTIPADAELIFRAEAEGFAETDTGANWQHFAKPDARPVEMVLAPEARLNGRVVSRVPGAKLEGLWVWLDTFSIAQHAETNAQGQFSLRGLPEGIYRILLDEGYSGSDWVARSAPAVQLRAANTSEVEIELFKVIVVKGTVVDHETGKPMAGIQVIAESEARPRPWRFTADTDKEGRYRLRLPPGEANFIVLRPKGLKVPPGHEGSQKAVVPEGVENFAGPNFTLTRQGDDRSVEWPIGGKKNRK
jgi:hypothetical protein